MTQLDTRRFEFIAHALAGSGGFADGRFLVKYPRESDAKYDRRREIAFYINHLMPAVSRFVGYLIAKPPMRETGGVPLFDAVIDDADYRGNSLDSWFSSFSVQAKARGSMLALVDMPRAVPGDLASQIASRAVPYLVQIKPEAVTRYSTDVTGAFTFIEWKSTIDDGQGSRIDVLRRWDSTSWSVVRGIEVIDSGVHALGVVPVVAFSEGDEFGCTGPFAQIADIGLRLYNMRSELDEILRSQTFSIMAYQVPEQSRLQFDVAKSAESIGTHNMLVYYGDAPSFIAPPDGPARVYMDSIASLIAQINAIGMVIDEKSQAESGLARQLRFEDLNAALKDFSARMEDFERRVWSIVSRWLGVRSQVSVSWPDDFALSDLASDLEVAQNMVALGMPESYMREKRKQLAQADLSSSSPETLASIISDIDSASFETPAPSGGAA